MDLEKKAATKKPMSIFLLTLFFLVACGKKDGPGPTSNRDPDEAVRLYRSTSAALTEPGIDYFLISADHRIYLFYRAPTGKRYIIKEYSLLSEVNYTLTDKGEFKSYDIEGVAVSGEQANDDERLPTEILYTKRINEVALLLKKAILAVDLELILFFAQDTPSFSEDQLKLLKFWASDPRSLIKILENHHLAGIRISDLAEHRLYIKEKILNIPPGLGQPVAELLEDLEEWSIGPMSSDNENGMKDAQPEEIPLFIPTYF